MRIVRQNDNISGGVVATIGMFDGVHLGHRSVINYLKSEATKEGLQSAVITFSQHPQTILNPQSAVRQILSLSDKIKALEETGIDNLILLDFNENLASLSARQFIEVIRDTYSVKTLIVGYDHHFGHNRGESLSDYQRYGNELGVNVIPTPEYSPSGEHISSSTIRKTLQSGDVAKAATMLGRHFAIHGTVVHGLQNGRKIGYPTANIQPDTPDLIIPNNGVYAVKVMLGNKEYGGMLNIGSRPTLCHNGETSIEVNIFNFNEDIYGKEITVTFIERLRNERKMASLADLTEQLAADKVQSQKILKQTI